MNNNRIKPLVIVLLIPILEILISFTITLVLNVIIDYAISRNSEILKPFVKLFSKFSIVLILVLIYNKSSQLKFKCNRIKLSLVLISIFTSLMFVILIATLKKCELPNLNINDVFNFSCLLRVFIIMFVAPILEELLFRKWMFDYLSFNGFNTYLIIIITSLLFYLWHGELYRWELVLSGILFGYLYVKGSNVLYPIIGHATINLIVLILTPCPSGYIL